MVNQNPQNPKTQPDKKQVRPDEMPRKNKETPHQDPSREGTRNY